MKYIKEYLETVVKIKPLGELTTKEDELNDLSGEMVYIDGKCSDIFISHADYANWLEKQESKPNSYSGVSFEYNGHTWGMCARDNGVDILFNKKLIQHICEKQGEQKPANKVVEPKFKVGDWVVYNRDDYSREIIQVYDIRDGRYYFTDNVHFSWSIKECDEKSHLWSIKDAKPGDVLAEDPIERHPSSFVAIYKKQNEEDFEDFDSYCFVGFDGKFYENEDGHCSEGIHPATTEQRDLLFSKMHEAGYMWNAEKKEVMKIVTPIFNIGDRIRYKGHACDGVITEITDTDYICGDTKLPISTQDKLELVEQKSAEWSEEDEYLLYETIQHLEELIRIDKAKHCACDVQYYQRDIDWLKALKERYTWKPSDDQMHSLKQAIDSYTFEPDYLEELYEDLKELKRK